MSESGARATAIVRPRFTDIWGRGGGSRETRRRRRGPICKANRGYGCAVFLIIPGPSRRVADGAINGESLAAIRVRNMASSVGAILPMIPPQHFRGILDNPSVSETIPFLLDTHVRG